MRKWNKVYYLVLVKISDVLYNVELFKFKVFIVNYNKTVTVSVLFILSWVFQISLPWRLSVEFQL